MLFLSAGFDKLTATACSLLCQLGQPLHPLSNSCLQPESCQSEYTLSRCFSVSVLITGFGKGCHYLEREEHLHEEEKVWFLVSTVIPGWEALSFFLFISGQKKKKKHSAFLKTVFSHFPLPANVAEWRHGSWWPRPWLSVPSLPATDCMTLARLHLSNPVFSSLKRDYGHKLSSVLLALTKYDTVSE